MGQITATRNLVAIKVVRHAGQLLWRCNGRNGVSNHQPHDCLLNRLFRHRSKKTSKLRVNGLCAGNSPVTGEFLAQMAITAENVSISWRHHDWYGAYLAPAFIRYDTANSEYDNKMNIYSYNMHVFVWQYIIISLFLGQDGKAQNIEWLLSTHNKLPNNEHWGKIR